MSADAVRGYKRLHIIRAHRKKIFDFFLGFTLFPPFYLIPELTMVFSMDFCIMAKIMKFGKNSSKPAAAEAP